MNRLNIYLIERAVEKNKELYADYGEYEFFVVISADSETAKTYLPEKDWAERWVAPELTKATYLGVAASHFIEGEIICVSEINGG